MALLKAFETPQGVVGNYHKILKADINCESETVTIWVQVYASAEARDAGKGMFWMEYITVPFDKLTQDPRGLLYPMVAYFGDSTLRGGVPDEEGDIAPGDFSINLTEEALVPSPPPEPVMPKPAPVEDIPPEEPVYETSDQPMIGDPAANLPQGPIEEPTLVATPVPSENTNE